MRSFILSFALLMGLTAPTSAQLVGTITGQVTDEAGQGIPAVQVFLLGPDVGTLSQADGRYLLLNVPTGTHRLRAERIGYQSVTVDVTVGSGATVVQDFLMPLEALAMDEIVVTGVPGGTRVRAIGNAVGRLDVAAITNLVPVADVQAVLRGRTPGVNMMGGGMVGQAPRIRIRGASTLSLKGQPLIYIDGVRANNNETSGYTYGNNAGVRGILSSLDPEQIERIEVLKGPAAATLYGTEASRGVINIITKRGEEGRVRVEVTVRQGANYMANPQGKVGYLNYWRDSGGEVHTLNQLERFSDEGRELYTAGHVQNYSATLSGGSRDTQFFFAATYMRETGILSHNWQKKLNVRTNFNTQIRDNFNVALNMGYTNVTDRLVTDGFASITEGIEFASPRYLPEFRCVTNPSTGCDLFDGFSSFSSPARERSRWNTQDLNRFTGGLTFNFQAFEWLTARLTTGIDYTGELNVAFRDFQTNDTTVATLTSNAAKGFRNEGRWDHFLTTTDFSTTADVQLTSRLSATTSVGFQYYTSTTSFLTASGQQFAGPGLSTITATAIQGTPQNNRISNMTIGSYVQETLAWQDRLFLTAALRVDNNSAFGNEINLVTYPKFALSWVMNEEGWFEDVAPSWLNTLRIRGAWGESGEQPASFSALRTWSPVSGPQNTAGVTPNTVGNPDLTAEVGQETELGLDADLFGNRLGLQVTYYHKLTKDAILERDLPPSGGFTGSQFVNAGKIVNNGLELALNANLVDGSALRWDVGFNLSFNNAKILQLSGEQGDTTIVFNSWQSLEHRVGHAPFSWFGRDVVSADLDAMGNVTNALCSDGAGGTTPCFDANGNTIAPRVDLGRAIAPWEMSLSTNVSIGDRLSFHALFTSERGHKRFDNTQRQRCRLYRLCRENYFPDEWDPEMKVTIDSSDQIIDAWVNDVSFVRLKEVSLTYELPANLRFGMSRATAQIAGRNLLTFTDWTAGDPETMFSSGGRAFMAQNNLPMPQQIMTTIRFTF